MANDRKSNQGGGGKQGGGGGQQGGGGQKGGGGQGNNHPSNGDGKKDDKKPGQ